MDYTNHTNADILNSLNKILEKSLRISKNELPSLHTRLSELPMDSLDYAEIIMEIEKAYRITITDEDELKFKTIDDIVSYISRSIKPVIKTEINQGINDFLMYFKLAYGASFNHNFSIKTKSDADKIIQSYLSNKDRVPTSEELKWKSVMNKITNSSNKSDWDIIDMLKHEFLIQNKYDSGL